MANWYVRELSKLTSISVQTLHHYDRIGLLKPSVRLPNGYRLYSEKDLSKLQQIIALKFFGFELAQIKELLNKEVPLKDHFLIQAKILEDRAKILLDASQALKKILSECSDKSILWEKIIKLIEVYHMTQELEKSWAGKALNEEELKEYVSFENFVKEHFSESDLKSFEKSWDDMVKDINANLTQEPSSDAGKAIAKRILDWVNRLYGKDFKKLSIAIWEKGFRGGYIGEDYKLSKEGIDWLDKAIDSYYHNRIQETLAKIGKQPDAEVSIEWNNLLTEMFGNESDLKDEVQEKIIKNSSQVVTNWFKKYYS